MDEMLQESRERYQAVITGALAVEQGCPPDETERKMRQESGR